MRDECMICKSPLVYLATDEEMECAICHKKENSKTRCVNGHYVCNRTGRSQKKANHDIFGHTVLTHDIFGYTDDINAIVSGHVECAVLMIRN